MKIWFVIAALSLLPLRGFAEEPVYLPLRIVPEKLEPNHLVFAIDNYVFRQITEGLFSIGDGFRIDPKLAASSVWSADGKTLTVKLRDAKLSDGSPVTAALAADAISRCLRESDKTQLIAIQAISGYEEFVKGTARYPKGLKINGDKTIEIHLDRQSPLLIDELGQPECYIVKPAPNGSLDVLHGAIGAGPYVFHKRTDNEVTLKKNPGYYGTFGGPQTAVYRKTDAFGKFGELKSWVTMTTSETEPPSDSAFEKIETSELGTYQLILNNSKAPFNKANIRKAVALGADYFQLSEEMHWGAERLQAGLIPFGMPGFRHRTREGFDENRKTAAELLKKAGYTDADPLKFQIVLPESDLAKLEAVAWSKVFHGLPVQPSVQLISFQDYVSRLTSYDFQSLRVTKYPGSVEPHRMLAFFLSTSKYNLTRSKLPECDAITKSSLQSVNREERFKVYAQAEDCLLKNAVLLPLSSMTPTYVMMRKPWKMRRTNRYLLYPYWISEWYRGE
jgi:oligopeptide transport system substrate-binding protein